jgi:hypothetical protein
MNHIREKLPDMKARLNTLMGQAQQELNSFGDSAAFGDANTVRITPLHLINQRVCADMTEILAYLARCTHPPSHDAVRA